MNEFAKLQLALQEAGIPFVMEEGESQVADAAEFLVLRKNDEHLIQVEWRPRGGFGISVFRRSDPPSGFDGPDEMYRNAALAALRIVELWETESRTDASRQIAVTELRLLRGMTQKALAEALGVDVSVVTKREAAATGSMRVDTLMNLVNALGGELELCVKIGETRRVLSV